jgi:hypothetical protein
MLTQATPTNLRRPLGKIPMVSPFPVNQQVVSPMAVSSPITLVYIYNPLSLSLSSNIVSFGRRNGHDLVCVIFIYQCGGGFSL